MRKNAIAPTFLDEDERQLSPALHVPSQYRLSQIRNIAYNKGKHDAKKGEEYISLEAPSIVKGGNFPVGKLSEEEKDIWLESYSVGVSHAAGMVVSTPRKRGRPKGFKDMKPRKRRTKAEMLAGVPKKNPVLSPGTEIEVIDGHYKGPGHIIAYVPYNKYRVFLYKLNDERLIPASHIARQNGENNMSAIRMNPRTKGAKDKSPCTRATIVQLRIRGREDKRDGLPAMQPDSIAYMYGYTGGRNKPHKITKKATSRRGRPKGSLNKKTVRKIQDEQDFYRYNPLHHYPKMKNKGRPSSNKYWIIDLYNKDNLVKTHIGKGPKEQSQFEAKNFIGSKASGKTINKVILSGPYDTKPNKNTVRR